MRIQIISAGLLLAIVAAGCNPVGTENTKVWVTGTIYVDSTFTEPAECIGVMTEVTPETYVASTDAQGEFLIEIQLFHDSEAEYTGSVTFGIKAIDGLSEHEYGGDDATFTVFGGDTLTLYIIDLGDFKTSGSGGS